MQSSTTFCESSCEFSLLSWFQWFHKYCIGIIIIHDHNVLITSGRIVRKPSSLITLNLSILWQCFCLGLYVEASFKNVVRFLCSLNRKGVTLKRSWVLSVDVMLFTSCTGWVYGWVSTKASSFVYAAKAATKLAFTYSLMVFCRFFCRVSCCIVICCNILARYIVESCIVNAPIH